METRICTKCGEEKPETTEYFCRHKECRGGLNTTCKVCCNKDTRKWRAENPEKARDAVRRWMARNPEKVREAAERRRNSLAPSYLKELISAKYNIDRSEIGEELLVAKRRELKYYRQLKQLKK